MGRNFKLQKALKACSKRSKERVMEIQVRQPTPSAWADFALTHFDEFLVDHAACERKASATGIQFVVRYPDRPELVDPMIRLAREELLHFHQVMRIITRKGVKLLPDEKDPYVNQLLAEMRHNRDKNFLDRLLVFGIVEARGTERFGLIGELHPDPEMKDFYQKLTEAEGRHHQLFVDLACRYFSKEEVAERLDELLDQEAAIVRELPLRAAVH